MTQLLLLHTVPTGKGNVRLSWLNWLVDRQKSHHAQYQPDPMKSNLIDWNQSAITKSNCHYWMVKRRWWEKFKSSLTNTAHKLQHWQRSWYPALPVLAELKAGSTSVNIMSTFICQWQKLQYNTAWLQKSKIKQKKVKKSHCISLSTTSVTKISSKLHIDITGCFMCKNWYHAPIIHTVIWH